MSDFTKLSRRDWINLAEDFNENLFTHCSQFSDKEWNKTSPYIGWRVRDVLVNITRAKVVNFWQLLERAMDNNPVAPSEFNTFLRGHVEVEPRKNVPIQQLIDNFLEEYSKLLEFYKGMSDEDWLKPGWFFVGPMNIRGLFLTEFGDNVFHLRDMLLPNNKWEGLDKSYTNPLTDWFMREYRPAHFREENSNGIKAKILYRLSGTGGGAWTMTIENNNCTVERGTDKAYDVIMAADVEDLVSVALARSKPWVGSVARKFDWIKGNERQTEVVATIQHYSAFINAVLNKKIRFGGNKKLGIKVNRTCFWHFYQRTKMTEHRIQQSRNRT